MTSARIPFAVAILAASLAACAPVEQPGGEAPGEPITATFVCPQAQLVTVTFTDGLARLAGGGIDAELVQQPSGSGYSYAGEGHSLRGKGTDVTWTDPAGTVRECRDQAASTSG